MRDDLMPAQIEIHPLIRTASLRTAKQAAIESARGGEIMDGEGEMERLERHRLSLSRR
jgi:hypothetical protein